MREDGADAIVQAVLLELRKMVIFLLDDKEKFADMQSEKQYMEAELQKSIVWSEKVVLLYETMPSARSQTSGSYSCPTNTR